MSEKELSKVCPFTVGHEEYGSVRWDTPIDVRQLDLDQVRMKM